MKRFFLLSLFCALLCSQEMMAETWSHTFANGNSVSNNSMTISNATWSIATTTGAGSPSISFGNAYSNYCIKFGSGAKNCYSKVTLSTNYFSNSNYTVSKVEIDAIGSAAKSMTFNVNGTSKSASIAANAWSTVTIDNLNVTTDLSIAISPNSAGVYVKKIVVTYSTSGGTTDPEPEPELTPLATPTNLQSSNVAKTVVDLSWDAVENATGYIVKVGTRETEVTTTSYHYTGLYAGVEYSWSVKAVGDGETYSNSEYADEESFTTSPHTITWSVNGQTSTSTYKNNVNIAFSEPSNLPDGKAFVGWVSEAIDGTTNTAPEIITSKKATKDETFYAVFATASGDGIHWEKVTDIAAMETGTYALISSDGHAFNGTFSTGNSSNGYQTTGVFSFNGDGIASSAPAGTCELTITATENATSNRYTIYSAADEKYLCITNATSGNLSFKVGPETNYWDFSKNDNQEAGAEQFRYHYSNTAQLRYYNSTFRNYNTSTNNGEVVSFAKKVGSISYSDYCTTVSTSTNISVSSVGFSTFYDSEHAVILPENVYGMVATLSGNTLSFNTAYNGNDEEAKVVPAGEAIVVNAPAGTHSFVYTTTEKAKQENILLGTDEATTTTAPDAGNYQFYGLSLDSNGENVGFYWMVENGAAFTNGAHKAYLAVPVPAGGSAPIRFLFNATDTATSIENIETSPNSATGLYKFFENGQVIIIRDGIRYNALGQKIQ